MIENVHNISTDKVQEAIKNNEYQIIDTRPTAAYNGWQLKGEKRKGHITGARSLPVKWANYIDWIEIVRNKEILPDQTIIVYGYTDQDNQKVIDRFWGAGYKNIFLYDKFFSEWCEDDRLPMSYLHGYKQLVYPEWLHSLIEGHQPPEYSNGDNYVVCHAHYRNYDDYLAGHIPGALALNTLSLESPATWNRRTSDELKTAFEELGITPETTVILYGRYSFPDNNDPFPGSSAGHLGAIRCALIMMYAGIKDVRVLNGGFAAWEAEKLSIETHPSKPSRKVSFDNKIPQKPELIVDIENAKKMIEAKDADIVCTRSYPEYIGEVSGYNYIEKKGRIPGAVYINNGSDAYHMENYQNLDYTTREFSEVEKMLTDGGLSPDKHLAFYCGTGWRGSEAFFNAYLLGWPRVSVFDGGWFEWSNDPENPYETGIPEEDMRY